MEFIHSIQWILLCVIALAQSSPLGTTRHPENDVNPEAGVALTCLEVCMFVRRKAYCNSRNLTYIPSSTGCEGAILLDLKGNNITNVTAEMSGYREVSTLDISGNSLSTITPDIFERNSELTNVDMSDNWLTILENKTFSGTEQMLSLMDLRNNQIYSIEVLAFESLEQVKTIYLSQNNLETLSPMIFKDLVSLYYLDLGFNKLTDLPSTIFRNQQSLVTLNLNMNHLQHIPTGLFLGLDSLKQFFLSSNWLISLPSPYELCLSHMLLLIDLSNNSINQSSVIIPFSYTTEKLTVTDNPLICDCNFKKLPNSQQSLVTSPQNTIQCMYHNGSNYTISETLPFECDETTETPTEAILTKYHFSTESIPDGNHSSESVPKPPPPVDTEGTVSAKHFTKVVVTLVVVIILLIIFNIVIIIICVKLIRTNRAGVGTTNNSDSGLPLNPLPGS